MTEMTKTDRGVLRLKLRVLTESNWALGGLIVAAIAVSGAALIISAYSEKGGTKNLLPKTFHGRYAEALRAKDIGEIPRGGSAPFAFELKNVSKSPVRLTEGPSSCSCLVSKLLAHVLQPGETTTITGSIRGELEAGSKEISFVVHADPAEQGHDVTATSTRESVKFVVSGRMSTDCGVLPGRIHVKLSPETSEIVRWPFSVLWEAGPDAHLELESTSEMFSSAASFELPQSGRPKGNLMEFPVVLVLDPTKLSSETNRAVGMAMFALKSRAFAAPFHFQVPLIVDRVGAVVASPNLICWSKANKDSPVNVRLEAADGVEVRIAELNFDKSLTDCHVESPAKGESEVVVKCLAARYDEILRSELKIDVEYGPEQKRVTITIPVLIL
jgi:hypothetical protein